MWRRIERIAGILFAVGLSLYVIRCGATGSVLTFNQFDEYLRGLVAYIFG